MRMFYLLSALLSFALSQNSFGSTLVECTFLGKIVENPGLIQSAQSSSAVIVPLKIKLTVKNPQPNNGCADVAKNNNGLIPLLLSLDLINKEQVNLKAGKEILIAYLFSSPRSATPTTTISWTLLPALAH